VRRRSVASRCAHCQRTFEQFFESDANESEVAAEALLELRRAQLNISLAWLLTKMPIKEPAEMQHYVEGFRRAGLE
jgi:hypothetical protein